MSRRSGYSHLRPHTHATFCSDTKAIRYLARCAFFVAESTLSLVCFNYLNRQIYLGTSKPKYQEALSQLSEIYSFQFGHTSARGESMVSKSNDSNIYFSHIFIWNYGTQRTNARRIVITQSLYNHDASRGSSQQKVALLHSSDNI